MTDGIEIGYVVTHLEMTARPARARLHAPALRGGLSLTRTLAPPPHFFRYLYGVVGAAYEWTDRDADSDADLAAFIQHSDVELYVPSIGGVPSGLALLDFRARPVCDLAYFGLTPEALGKGLGSWLLGEVVHMAWDKGVSKITLHTCTLDHPRALATYQKWGFAPVRREEQRRIVSPPFLARRPELAP